jgi:GxxExxY protein
VGGESHLVAERAHGFPTKVHDDTKDTMEPICFSRMIHCWYRPTNVLSQTRSLVGSPCIENLDQVFARRFTNAHIASSWNRRGIKFECEKRIEVKYRNWLIPGQRIDLIVASVVLVEIKVVPRLRKLHTSQVLSYLKTTGLRVGLLMNFNTPLFKDGLRRVVLSLIGHRAHGVIVFHREPPVGSFARCAFILLQTSSISSRLASCTDRP